MENTDIKPVTSLFHTGILENELNSPSSVPPSKTVLEAWIKGLDELRKKDSSAQCSAFASGILEKLLGYDASTLELNTSPNRFFDIFIKNTAKDETGAAVKIIDGFGISSAQEKTFLEKAWKNEEVSKSGFYLMTNLNEIRLYPASRKEKSFERFNLTDLLEDDAAFKRFYLLMNADNLMSGKTAKWLHESAVKLLQEKLTGTYPTLKEMYGPVHQGITTGLDEAFIVDEATKTKLVEEDPRSADILKPFADKQDIEKWATESRSLWLIYTPANLYNIDDYPAIKKHLEGFRDKLEKRSGTQKWYELQNSGAHPEKMFGQKLGFAKESVNSTFSVDKSGDVFGQGGFYTTESDYYLVALLNSSLFWYLIRQSSAKKEDGVYELTATQIENLPIPDAPGLIRGRMGQLSDYCQDTVLTRNDLVKHFRGMTAYNLLPDGLSSRLTQKLHNWFAHEFDAFRSEINTSFNTDIAADDLQLWNDYFYQERKKVFDLNADIAHAEYEIDHVVYELFGVTRDEIDLIERL